MSDTTELIQADYTIDDACVSGNVFAKQAVEGIYAFFVGAIHSFAVFVF